MLDKTFLKPCYKLLKSKSGKPDWYLTGLLESLFIYTSNNAYTGALTKQQFNQYVIWAEFTDIPANNLLELFIDSGWIHDTEEYCLVINEWHDIAADYIKRKAKRNGVTFPSELVMAGHSQSQPVITDNNQPQTNGNNTVQPCPDMYNHNQSCTTMSSHDQPRPEMSDSDRITKPNLNLTKPNHNQTSGGGSGELESYRKLIKNKKLVEQFKPYLDCKDESTFYQTIIRWQRDYLQPLWEMTMLQAIDNGKTLPPSWYTPNLEAKKTEFLKNPEALESFESEISEEEKRLNRIDKELLERCQHIKRYSNDENFNLKEWLARKEQQKRLHDLPEAEKSKHWDEYQSLIREVAA